jgi:hypothetical protein
MSHGLGGTTGTWLLDLRIARISQLPAYIYDLIVNSSSHEINQYILSSFSSCLALAEAIAGYPCGHSGIHEDHITYQRCHHIWYQIALVSLDGKIHFMPQDAVYQ